MEIAEKSRTCCHGSMKTWKACYFMFCSNCKTPRHSRPAAPCPPSSRATAADVTRVATQPWRHRRVKCATHARADVTASRGLWPNKHNPDCRRGVRWPATSTRAQHHYTSCKKLTSPLCFLTLLLAFCGRVDWTVCLCLVLCLVRSWGWSESNCCQYCSVHSIFVTHSLPPP